MKTLFAIILFFSTISGIAWADCSYEGSSYPTGTVIGPLVCSPDGTWQPRRWLDKDKCRFRMRSERPAPNLTSLFREK